MNEGKISVQTLIIAVIVSVVLSVGAFTIMKDGFVGPAGEQGIDGIQGLQGVEGTHGIQGIQGIQGDQGERGDLKIFGSVQNKTVGIDGYIDNGEWPAFTESELEYKVTYEDGIRNNELAWDTDDKLLFFSYFIEDEYLYVALVFYDDYLSEEFQIRSVYLYVNGYYKASMRWTTEHEYRKNSWTTHDMEGQYSHTGNGEPGADGLYIIEMKYPLTESDVDEVYDIAFQYAEVDRYSSGAFHLLTYWGSDDYEVALDSLAISQAADYVEIPGIVNGGFDGMEGWVKQGMSSGMDGALRLYQYTSGTRLTQRIMVGENQGLAFDLMSNGARLEVHLDDKVIYYADLSEGLEWTRVVVPFPEFYVGPRDIYFRVLAADSEGIYIGLDNITLVDFMIPTTIQDYSQTIEYNISAGTDRTWEFLISEYGIIWEARISFSGVYISMSHAYSMGGDRVFVGSSGLALDRPDIPTQYYPDQEYLWGTITVEYYLDSNDENRIWVMGYTNTNLPTIKRDASAYVDIS